MGTSTQAPYEVRVDPDTARGLAEQGGTLLMLGVPPGSCVGVDQQLFSAGPKFKGVKMLPPGPHFFSCRAMATSGPAAGACAPPTGFFTHVAPRQVVVKVWDAATEQLLDMPDADEAQRYAEGVRRFEFDAYLAPYDLSSYQQWSRMSHHITAPLISALSPVGGNISIMAEAEDPELSDPKTEAERQLVQQLQQGRAKLAERQQAAAASGNDQQGQQEQQAAAVAGNEQQGQRRQQGQQHHNAGNAMDTDEVALQTPTEPYTASSTPMGDAAAGGTPASPSGRTPDAPQHQPAPAATATAGRRRGRCFYTHLPRLVKQRGLSAAELTAMNMDKSAQLLQAVGQRYGGSMESLLGEMQFAFVAFVFGQSLDGFAQWKSLLMLALGCEDAALRSHQPAFVNILRVLRGQLSVALGPDSTSSPTAVAGGDSTGQEAPFGLPMVEELLPDSFLRKMFGQFFRMLQENQREVSQDMYNEMRALKQLLRSKLGWEYDIRVVTEECEDDDDGDDDDDLPVIVDVNEPYAL